ncbi:MAG: sigma factor [Desulfitobacteriaceae bacterium]
MHYTLNKEDARDVTQEIFIKTYNKLTVFKHNSTFSFWLYRIAIMKNILILKILQFKLSG